MPLLAAGAALLLAGCATPASVAPGVPHSQLIERHGRPDATYPLPGGGTRLEYTMGPYQQTTWMVDLDAAGRALGSRQVRTLQNFMALRNGIDTADTVRREFGTPWRVERYRLSGLTALMYPHQEAGFFASMAAVHVDRNGIVQFVQNGPDPRFLGGGDRND
jgi:hypothetical protein